MGDRERRPIPQPTIEAMQWQPGDLAAAGMLVGWLLRSGVQFNHPSGEGETTTLAIKGQPLALPGDWIAWDGERFRTHQRELFEWGYGSSGDGDAG